MHSESDNIKIIVNDEADEVIEELFESRKKKNQNKLKESMEGSDFLLIMFIYCIINVIKQIPIVMDNIYRFFCLDKKEKCSNKFYQ